MIEMIIGTIFGALVSWVFSEWYYRKAKVDSDKQSPIPLLIQLTQEVQGIKTRLGEDIKQSALEVEISGAIDRVLGLVTKLRHQIAHAYLPLDIILQGLVEAKRLGKWESVQELLDSVSEYRDLAIKKLFTQEQPMQDIQEVFLRLKSIAEQPASNNAENLHV
ncbi:MAG: hypothetical protein HY097_02255 [Nitrospinae bacterium]|nr:hypothetical protein [Nitrospinota bacterium]MBI3814059.1 hypothetical protein [Nitrospinota bacterium]